MAELTVHRYERRDPRLGRHVAHDPRSRGFDLAQTFGASIPSKPIDWYRADADVFDQGNVGACTAAATLGLLVTAPFRKPGRIFNIRDILDFYHDETVVDDFPGTYPPDDTGSDGRTAMAVLRARGYATGYKWAFSPASALAALNHGPIALGIPWTESMMTPRNGQLIVNRKSPVIGGHEIAADAWNPTDRKVRLTNSWGLNWPGSDHGRVWLRYSDLAWLLGQSGDVVQPVVV